MELRPGKMAEHGGGDRQMVRYGVVFSTLQHRLHCSWPRN